MNEPVKKISERSLSSLSKMFEGSRAHRRRLAKKVKAQMKKNGANKNGGK